ncbi:MAG: glycosyltransferase [Candidatus Omnitrophica bacterium]|nr:glycosyltransferase [Candidatus Omnitrophota bacterium]
MSCLKVAIIIPVKRFNNKLKKSIEKCLGLDYQNVEIIVFPDDSSKEFDVFNDKIKVVPTGNMGPALKRDLALNHSRAELFAFLDDDAYPEPDWLKNAVPHFEQEDVAAVGGPSVTPRESTLWAHGSGHVFSSIFVSGPYLYRYLPGKKKLVEDYPSCNFIVRRDIFEGLGGFDNTFWPGEDTKLCLDITKKSGKKIVYDPAVLVHHHRRELGLSHFKQVANYALHRGYFAKRFPETSLRLAYFIPSLFVAYVLAGGGLSFLNKKIALAYLFSMAAYFVIILINVIYSLLRDKIVGPLVKVKLVFPVVFGIVGTHFCYGIFLLKGLLASKLKEEM